MMDEPTFAGSSIEPTPKINGRILQSSLRKEKSRNSIGYEKSKNRIFLEQRKKKGSWGSGKIKKLKKSPRPTQFEGTFENARRKGGSIRKMRRTGDN